MQIIKVDFWIFFFHTSFPALLLVFWNICSGKVILGHLILNDSEARRGHHVVGLQCFLATLISCGCISLDTITRLRMRRASENCTKQADAKNNWSATNHDMARIRYWKGQGIWCTRTNLARGFVDIVWLKRIDSSRIDSNAFCKYFKLNKNIYSGSSHTFRPFSTTLSCLSFSLFSLSLYFPVSHPFPLLCCATMTHCFEKARAFFAPISLYLIVSRIQF